MLNFYACIKMYIKAAAVSNNTEIAYFSKINFECNLYNINCTNLLSVYPLKPQKILPRLYRPDVYYQRTGLVSGILLVFESHSSRFLSEWLHQLYRISYDVISSFFHLEKLSTKCSRIFRSGCTHHR